MNKEITDNLNLYLANLNTLYVKFHNLHWNVVGKQFKNIHEYLEVIYDGFANSLDEIAEILKMHNVYPLASMKDYLNTTTIKELDSKDYTIDDVLNISKEDLSTMKCLGEKIRKLADDSDLYDIVSIIEDHLTNYSKTLWFLNSMLK